MVKHAVLYEPNKKVVSLETSVAFQSELNANIKNVKNEIME
jgi:hypothetical protein